MAYRNNNRRSFDRSNYGGSISRSINPWENSSGMRGGNNGGGGGGPGGNMMQQNSNINSTEALTLANNLINNLLRGNQQQVPSLLDIPTDMRGGPYGGRDNYGRFDDRPRAIGNRNAVNASRNRRAGGQRTKSGVKLGAIRKPNPNDRSKKILGKNSNNSKSSSKTDSSADNTNNKNDESKDENGMDVGNTGKSRRESAYAEVPSDMLYCHMCKKHMWDSTSFENHVKGRTHQMMKEGIEESYRLKANMIRQEAKIAEQLKSIEIDRLKRMGKNVKASNQLREYCTMCDLHFYGHLSTHRKSEGHLNLKKFLHPKCIECNKEFPTRTDYDSHVLSPSHMKKASTKTNRFRGDRKNQIVILCEAEELANLKEGKEERKEETENSAEDKDKSDSAAATTGEGAENTNGTATEEGAVDADGIKIEPTEVKMEESAPVEEEPADIILDFAEGTEIPIDIDSKLPKYNSNRPVASTMINKLECYECHLCNRYLDTEKTAEIHSRTIQHHRQFIKFLNEKSQETKIAQKRAAASEENEKRKRETLEQQQSNGDDAEKKDAGNDLYDPSEATADDEDENNVDKSGENWNDSLNNTTIKAEDVEMNETQNDVADESTEGGVANADENTDEPMADVAAVEDDKAPEIKEEETKDDALQTPVKQVEQVKASPQTITPQNQRNTNNRGGNRSGGNRNNTPRNNRGRGRYNRY